MVFKPLQKISDDGFNVTEISLCVHTGTHIDAPIHCVDNGVSVDKIELDGLVGPVTVFDLGKLNPLSQITAIDLQKCADKNKHSSRLFIKTGWGSRYGNAEYFSEFPSITQDAADWLIENKIKLIGVEQPSLNVNEDLKIHQMLLGAGIICIENLANMDKVSAGNYNMAALPLKLSGLDGAPVRVIISSESVF